MTFPLRDTRDEEKGHGSRSREGCAGTRKAAHEARRGRCRVGAATEATEGVHSWVLSMQKFGVFSFGWLSWLQPWCSHGIPRSGDG